MNIIIKYHFYIHKFELNVDSNQNFLMDGMHNNEWMECVTMDDRRILQRMAKGYSNL